MSEKLTLEEIKSLSDAELGKLLADLCGINTVNNGGSFTSPYLFCESLDVVARAERFVIEKVGIDNYYDAHYESSDEPFIASARERAEACLLALQGTE